LFPTLTCTKCQALYQVPPIPPIVIVGIFFVSISVFRCILERDPIAQKHAARIQKMRGTYDSMGNRVPPPQPNNVGGRRSKSSGNLGMCLLPAADQLKKHSGETIKTDT
jgi:hypothetical protein